MSTPAQGEICLAEAEGKRRPVLIVTRNEAIPVLTWLVVAPVTRDGPGSPHRGGAWWPGRTAQPCAATFDNLQPIRRSFLTQRVGRLDEARRSELCRALSALADC